jgi:hypothetical protein
MSSTSPESFADDIVAIISHDLRAFDTASDRSQQSRSGILGPSDIGFCRQKAALVTRGIDPTDEKKMWAAQVGTAVHNYVEAALKTKHPDWLMGSIDQLHVTAILPSGAEIGGHPDIVIPDLNTILDIKTVDGFEWVKRNGTSASHKYQRHLYALGAIQEGILDPSQPVYVGNLYFDRSGKEQEPLLLLEPFTHDLSDEIDQWVSDVAYAVMNKEDAMRDIAPSTCVQTIPPSRAASGLRWRPAPSPSRPSRCRWRPSRSSRASTGRTGSFRSAGRRSLPRSSRGSSVRAASAWMSSR